ncbi:hypothetical protein JCGZ_18211 [Jatropha curcas]|uniref:Uncharacterized protein n=1 Tax=Jatropha curcas TaxID=180498 RepID=A0A067KEA2_JATCU|nr:hypothetical protein JCGZ_18211 [Jatropha curcas]
MIESKPFKPIKPSLEDASTDPIGADKADQTELSRWPDDQIKTLQADQTELRRYRHQTNVVTDLTGADKADQTEL